MGETLGHLHWRAGYDGRDVEFIMGGPVGHLSVAWLCTLLILIRCAANRALLPSLGLLTLFFFP